MNRKIMKLMAACIITVIFLRNGMADICYAMNKTEIGRDDAGEASVTASLTANGARTSLNASSSETSDFQVQGYVYGINDYLAYRHDAYQTSACSFSDNWKFVVTYAQAKFEVSGYSGDCTINLIVQE